MIDMNDKWLQESTDQKGLFDFKKVWTQILVHWYWVLLSIILCVGGAVVYLKYTSPVYVASMKFLVKDSNQKGYHGMGMSLGEMGYMSNSNGFDNELEILRSASLATNVVERLNLYTKYFLEGSVKDTELYRNTPFVIELDKSFRDSLNATVSFELSVRENICHIEGYLGQPTPGMALFSEDVAKYPTIINTPIGKLFIDRPEEYFSVQAKQEADNVYAAMQKGSSLQVVMYPSQTIGRMYAASVKAAATAKTTTVAEVSLTDTKTNRALDFLNELFVCYNHDANEDKNEIARKTEEFITERLVEIKRELDSTEGTMESYKKDNELVNLANDATTALSASSSYRKELLAAQTQVSVLRSLVDYMDSPENYLQIIPANLGLEGGALIAPLIETISEYNAKVQKKNRYERGSSSDNPIVVNLASEVAVLWTTIRSNIDNVILNAEMRKSAIEKEYKKVVGRISQTPTQERMLTNILRQQTLQSELYLTLLQKREENFIQLYSTATKGRLIDEPIITGMVSPKRNMILLYGLLFGLLIPVIIILIRESLRYRIEGRKDVEKLCKLPILADIPMTSRIDKKTNRCAVVVRENSNEAIEEAFRELRANIDFVLKRDEKVLMVTSCISGEGKTFIAANLAMSLALLGRKVILVGLDIRKPRLVSLFGLKPTKRGVVNFLCAANEDYELLESQIIPSQTHVNMDVLPAGVIPPNPAELLSSPMLKSAIDYLSQKYDYVILDTPPVAYVSDTLTIGANVDMTIFVTRVDYSPKTNFELINDIVRNERLPKCNVVLNAIDMDNRRHRYQFNKYGQYGSYYSQYGTTTQDGKYHVEK